MKRALLKLMMCSFMALPVLGENLFVPENSRVIERHTGDAVLLPSQPIEDGQLDLQHLSGVVTREARVMVGAEPSAVMASLFAAYRNEGFEEVFKCVAKACGGFDFRYAIETPTFREFRVNLDNYEYAEMRNEETVVTFLVSSEDDQTFLQQVYVDIEAQKEVPLMPQLVESLPPSTQRTVLSSVTFALGSSQIQEYDPIELEALAIRLGQNSHETLYLVGHSDQIGGLEPNRRLSRQRAASVRKKLIEDFNIAGGRVIADGVAFLAPIADNKSEIGRARNRRVEAVFLSNG